MGRARPKRPAKVSRVVSQGETGLGGYKIELGVSVGGLGLVGKINNCFKSINYATETSPFSGAKSFKIRSGQGCLERDLRGGLWPLPCGPVSGFFLGGPDFEKAAQNDQRAADHFAGGQAFASKDCGGQRSEDHFCHQQDADSCRVQP